MERQLLLSTAKQISSTDTGIRLLCSRTSPDLLTFFYNTFTAREVAYMPQEDFEKELNAFLKIYQDADMDFEEDLEEDGVDIAETTQDERLKNLITRWLNRGYIKRDVTPSGNMIRLDLDVSRLLRNYISAILDIREGHFTTKAGFRALESIYSDIRTRLLSQTKEQRIEEIERQIKELEREKKELEENRIKFAPASNLEIINALDNASRQMTQFKHSFSELDENFKQILKSSAKKRAEGSGTKAERFTEQRDMLFELFEQPQHQDFKSFLSTIRPDVPDTIGNLTIDIMRGLIDRGIIYDLSTNLSFRDDVFNMALEVSDNYRRYYREMAQTLKSGKAEEFVGVSNALKDCRQALLALKNNERYAGTPYSKLPGTFEGLSFLRTYPLIRKLQISQEKASVPVIEFAMETDIPVSAEVIEALRESGIEVDRNRLKSNLETYRKGHGAEGFTLKELVSAYPLKQDLAEVFEYILIAIENGGESAIDREEREEIPSDTGKGRYIYRLPRVNYKWQ